MALLKPEIKIYFFILTAIIHEIRPIRSQLLKPQLDKLSEDGRLTFPGLAAKYGFPAQQDNIITEDGYILTMFHIPGNSSRPVLLIHGNTANADCWIIRGNGSLAVVLAKQGYDVWAINLRGTRYSRKHIYLDPDEQPDQFFDYSFYEEAIYDVPATIDFILQRTGQTQLLVIAHSVGTTLLYVLGAEKPEYNDKIKLGVSLAPISFIQNVRGLGALGIALGPELIPLLKTLGFRGEILGYDQFGPLIQAICLEPLGYTICIELVLFSILGTDAPNFEPKFLPNFFGHYPAGTTTKIFEHLIQVARRKKFAKYDYGIVKNLEVYQSVEPPEFDLKKVTMKSALFVGQEDYLGTVADAQLLKASLPNVVHYQVLPYDKFNHADFIWGKNMTGIFFPYLLDLVDKYK